MPVASASEAMGSSLEPEREARGNEMRIYLGIIEAAPAVGNEVAIRIKSNLGTVYDIRMAPEKAHRRLRERPPIEQPRGWRRFSSTHFIPSNARLPATCARDQRCVDLRTVCGWTNNWGTVG